jgi:hypothetical protein
MSRLKTKRLTVWQQAAVCMCVRKAIEDGNLLQHAGETLLDLLEKATYIETKE